MTKYKCYFCKRNISVRAKKCTKCGWRICPNCFACGCLVWPKTIFERLRAVFLRLKLELTKPKKPKPRSLYRRKLKYCPSCGGGSLRVVEHKIYVYKIRIPGKMKGIKPKKTIKRECKCARCFCNWKEELIG